MANYHVTKRPAGGWNARRSGSDRTSGIYNSKKNAEIAAKKLVAKSGGGEVRLHGINGKIMDSDTVAPGKDQNPPKDQRH